MSVWQGRTRSYGFPPSYGIHRQFGPFEIVIPERHHSPSEYVAFDEFDQPIVQDEGRLTPINFQFEFEQVIPSVEATKESDEPFKSEGLVSVKNEKSIEPEVLNSVEIPTSFEPLQHNESAVCDTDMMDIDEAEAASAGGPHQLQGTLALLKAHQRALLSEVDRTKAEIAELDGEWAKTKLARVKEDLERMDLLHERAKQDLKFKEKKDGLDTEHAKVVSVIAELQNYQGRLEDILLEIGSGKFVSIAGGKLVELPVSEEQGAKQRSELARIQRLLQQISGVAAGPSASGGILTKGYPIAVDRFNINVFWDRRGERFVHLVCSRCHQIHFESVKQFIDHNKVIHRIDVPEVLVLIKYGETVKPEHAVTRLERQVEKRNQPVKSRDSVRTSAPPGGWIGSVIDDSSDEEEEPEETIDASHLHAGGGEIGTQETVLSRDSPSNGPSLPFLKTLPEVDDLSPTAIKGDDFASLELFTRKQLCDFIGGHPAKIYNKIPASKKENQVVDCDEYWVIDPKIHPFVPTKPAQHCAMTVPWAPLVTFDLKKVFAVFLKQDTENLVVYAGHYSLAKKPEKMAHRTADHLVGEPERTYWTSRIKNDKTAAQDYILDAGLCGTHSAVKNMSNTDVLAIMSGVCNSSHFSNLDWLTLLQEEHNRMTFHFSFHYLKCVRFNNTFYEELVHACEG
ncbi:hypothetical protein L228DRAFT_76104 [Xylona heveae TC161]|uniref:DUF6697 domain-containing protein n=1 Tax=Xylona heveae (strain CBS 132557 / TC161) TaxID=1328760 RepID=A0A165IUM2_XYLHT|nr:hypothetical protein L228DRAFT_76104 [Xylona heveae TC161]KZF25412.1 hypothetical protein L228DRAFT_76104 [Xylona heveae TC161]